MRALQSKRARDLSAADIDALCADKSPESDSIEFKRQLPSKGIGDPWAEKSDFGSYGRDALLREIVAFANSHGGRVVIGVNETADSPARADSVAPIPNFHDLAERLRLAAGDCIEPPIPLLDIVGVALPQDGVVVADVPESRMAPHRLRSDKECYVRRADRTVPMTMREIQDLTLNRERGTAATLAEIDRVWAKLIARADSKTVIRIAGAPVGAALQLPVLPKGAPPVTPSTEISTIKFPNAQYPSAVPTVFVPNCQPTLRGWNWGGSKHDRVNFQLYWNGAFGYCFPIEHTNLVCPEWLIWTAANALKFLDAVRAAAQAPTVEYALKLTMHAASGETGVLRFGGSPYEQAGSFIEPFAPPIYAVGGPETFNQVVNMMAQDFFNNIGVAFTGFVIEEFEH
jgi:hypothetical protein